MQNNQIAAAAAGFIAVLAFVYAMTPSDHQLAIDNARFAREIGVPVPIEAVSPETCSNDGQRTKACTDDLTKTVVTGRVPT